jgi:AraC-like DNA-binding protein/quercetin dioxygenase-like cupin family protein
VNAVQNSALFAPITFGAHGRARETAGLRIVETVHAPGVVLTPHEHEDPCIVAAIEGWWKEKVESRVFACGPGSFLSKPAGARHANAYGTEITREIIIQLTVTRAATWEPSRKVFADCVHFHSPRIATRLVGYLTHPNDHSSLELEEEICRIFSLLSGSRMPPRRKRFRIRRLERVRDELIDDPLAPRSLAALAAECDLSPSAFTHAFRNEFGCAPSTLIRRRRVEMSASLLRSSNRALSGVALATGFADQAHMTREFRRIVGTTPGEFRRLAAT